MYTKLPILPNKYNLNSAFYRVENIVLNCRFFSGWKTTEQKVLVFFALAYARKRLELFKDIDKLSASEYIFLTKDARFRTEVDIDWAIETLFNWIRPGVYIHAREARRDRTYLTIDMRFAIAMAGEYLKLISEEK